ncbi:MAG: universal stress protein [Nitrospirales bacterium]|nr:MAG: universal stress protein [Nitrospirales bacterium]
MNIILAVDGSEQSYEAGRGLNGLSRAEELIVLTVVDVPRLSYPSIGDGLAKDLSIEVEKAMREEGERLLERVISLLPRHPGPVKKSLQLGNPAEIIIDTADKRQANLIVLGARGLGQIQEKLFGSVSHRVMTHAPCSTLIVKESLRNIQNILIPLGNQEDGEAIVRFFETKPFREPAHVTLMHVVPFSQPVWPVGAMIPEDFRKEVIAHGEQITEGVAGKLRSLGHEANGFAVMGAPSISIADEVTQRKPDLIVMRTHSRSGLSRFFLGSVSHSVVHHTHCSVLLVR